MSLLGNRVLRTEDPKFLTVGGTYVGDIDLPGAAVAIYVRSPIAHARIESIDTSEAAAAPGVLAVFTAEDFETEPLPSPIPFPDCYGLLPSLSGDHIQGGRCGLTRCRPNRPISAPR